MNGIRDSMPIGQYQYAILLFYDIKHAIISITFTTAWFEDFDNIIFLNSPNSIIKHTIHLLTTNERCAFFSIFRSPFSFQIICFSFINQLIFSILSSSTLSNPIIYIFIIPTFPTFLTNLNYLTHSQTNHGSNHPEMEDIRHKPERHMVFSNFLVNPFIPNYRLQTISTQTNLLQKYLFHVVPLFLTI